MGAPPPESWLAAKGNPATHKFPEPPEKADVDKEIYTFTTLPTLVYLPMRVP